MEINKFPMLIVGVVVALVLAGAVLPVFAETTSATDTFKNEGYFRMDKLVSSSSDTVIIEYNPSAPDIFTVNGHDVKVEAGTNAVSIVASYSNSILNNLNWIVRYWARDDGTYLANFGMLQYHNTTADDWTITLNSGTATITSESGNWTATSQYDFVYYISNNGEYTMKNRDIPAYVKTDSEIYAIGTSNIPPQTGGRVVRIIGTVDNMSANVTLPPNGITTSNLQVVKSTLSAYIDLVALDKMTLTATIDETGEFSNIIYSYYIVPYEVTAEKAIHPDGALTVLLNILPLLVIAGLVAGSVAWFITRK